MSLLAETESSRFWPETKRCISLVKNSYLMLSSSIELAALMTSVAISME